MKHRLLYFDMTTCAVFAFNAWQYQAALLACVSLTFGLMALYRWLAHLTKETPEQ